jgi:hypothetical protein
VEVPSNINTAALEQVARWLASSEAPSDIGTAAPEQVAPVLKTTVDGLAQMRYRGTGPKFCKVSVRKVVYRWSDVRAYLEARNFQNSQEAALCRD